MTVPTENFVLRPRALEEWWERKRKEVQKIMERWRRSRRGVQVATA